MENDEMKKLIDMRIQELMPKYLKASAFTDRKITDIPTDSLEVVNRRYVTLNGATSARPTASVIGQRYFDTSLASGRGKPVWWNGTGFVDATGTYV